MSNWLIIVLASAALLLATWFAAEWACRRIAERYEGRKRLFTGLGPEDDPEAE